MNKISYIMITMFMAVAMSVSSCRQAEPEVAFGTDKAQISSEAEGGVFSMGVSSGESWVAMTDEPWISISPANGPRSTECEVRIDSTLISTGRTGTLRIRNTVTGETSDVKIEQKGFEYAIHAEKPEVEVSSYASTEHRVFEVRIKSNVPFEVSIPEDAKWLSCDDFETSFDRGARPRETSVRFRWKVNTRAESRSAQVSFLPKDGYEGASADIITVTQDAAEKIEIGHKGDSLAVVALFRNMNSWETVPFSDPMSSWDQVKLWEEGDKGYTPEKKGRVRSVNMFLFETDEGIPFEVQYLTEAEELTFFSNINSFLHDIEMGEYVCSLPNLKKLTISGYGLSDIPEYITRLSGLEYLDLSLNNFDKCPYVIRKENFPALRELYLNTCQRYYILDLSNSVRNRVGGMKGPFPRHLLEWDTLTKLRLSVNYFEGELPDMEDYPVRYTEEDCRERNLPPAMVGKPKVLPDAKYLAINLNRLYGRIPDWILYHPHLTEWEPYALVYPQEGRASDGRYASFSNVPTNMDYYWSFYDGYKEHVDIYTGN